MKNQYYKNYRINKKKEFSFFKNAFFTSYSLNILLIFIIL